MRCVAPRALATASNANANCSGLARRRCRGDEYTLWSRRECRYLTARDNPAVISKAKGSSQWLPSPADFLTPFIGIY